MPTSRRTTDLDSSPPANRQVLIRAIHEALTVLPPSSLTTMARFLGTWERMDGERRALLLKTLMRDLSDDEIAEASGVARRSLYRWPSYRRLKDQLADFFDFPEGFVDGDRKIAEAWFEEDH